MSKVLKWTGIALAVIFVAAQMIRPERTNPSVDQTQTVQAHLQLTPEVESIFKRSCYDCHSSETRWPWYSNVAPVSWWLADHVSHARSHMDFSNWAQKGGHSDKHDSQAMLDEICEEVKDRKMPLSSYLLLHTDAKLSDEDIKTICDWTKAESERLAAEAKSASN